MQDNTDLYPDERERFRSGLAAAGFVPTGEAPEAWEGEVRWEWGRNGDGPSSPAGIAVQNVRITFGPGFPFQRPAVVPVGDAVGLEAARHRAPLEAGGALCLYPERSRGWMPWYTAEELLERVREWLSRHSRDAWPAEDRPPDLHLYFPAGRRLLMLTGNDWPPPAGQSGRFGVWGASPVAAIAGVPRTGVEEPPSKGTERIFESLGISGAPRDLVGIWFRLNAEPRPRPLLGEMLAEIDLQAGTASGWAARQLRGLIGERIRGKGAYLIFAVGYPDHEGAEQWLFLRAFLKPSKGNKRRLWQDIGAVNVAAYETAPAGPDALARRTVHTARLLAGRSVLVFGAGAVGSSIAMLLAKAGVSSLTIVDSDRLRPGNVVRHAAGLPFVGMPKSLAVQAVVRQHAPGCTVHLAEETWEPVALGRLVGRSDVVVDATANEAFSLLLNEVCQREERPAIYVTTYRRASVGRVRVVRPRQDACPVCYLDGYAEMPDYPLVPLGDEGAFVEGGCGDPTVEASAVDVEAIANIAARSTLRLLQDRHRPEGECLLVNDPLEEGHPLLSRLGTHWNRREPIPGCGACSR